jgi:5-methylcytosine-specific restriction endonuclease McrA
LALNPRSPIVNADGTRTCKVCGVAKSIEEFPLDKRASLGRKGTCKPCWSKQASAWYAANQERQLARHQVRREANRDRIRRQDNERYLRDKPKRLALVVDAGNRRRATLRHGGPWDRGITCRALRERDGDLCCYCGITMTFEPATGHVFIPGKATIEHVLPISAGGTHTWENVALACWHCNVKKQARTLDQWTERPLPATEE